MGALEAAGRVTACDEIHEALDRFVATARVRLDGRNSARHGRQPVGLFFCVFDVFFVSNAEDLFRQLESSLLSVIASQKAPVSLLNICMRYPSFDHLDGCARTAWGDLVIHVASERG